eukprot:Hpha_TRINITY_DN16016_c5_g13::TRINITY_DN16016_c5_g13_i1::g.120978::m.120978
MGCGASSAARQRERETKFRALAFRDHPNSSEDDDEYGDEDDESHEETEESSELSDGDARSTPGRRRFRSSQTSSSLPSSLTGSQRERSVVSQSMSRLLGVSVNTNLEQSKNSGSNPNHVLVSGFRDSPSGVGGVPSPCGDDNDNTESWEKWIQDWLSDIPAGAAVPKDKPHVCDDSSSDKGRNPSEWSLYTVAEGADQEVAISALLAEHRTATEFIRADDESDGEFGSMGSNDEDDQRYAVISNSTPSKSTSMSDSKNTGSMSDSKHTAVSPSLDGEKLSRSLSGKGGRRMSTSSAPKVHLTRKALAKLPVVVRKRRTEEGDVKGEQVDCRAPRSSLPSIGSTAIADQEWMYQLDKLNEEYQQSQTSKQCGTPGSKHSKSRKRSMKKGRGKDQANLPSSAAEASMSSQNDLVKILAKEDQAAR